MEQNSPLGGPRPQFTKMAVFEAFQGIEVRNQQGVQFQPDRVIDQFRCLPTHAAHREIVEAELNRCFGAAASSPATLPMASIPSPVAAVRRTNCRREIESNGPDMGVVIECGIEYFSGVASPGELQQSLEHDKRQ